MHTLQEYQTLENQIASLMTQSIAVQETDVDQSVNYVNQAMSKREQINQMIREDEDEKRQEFEALKERVRVLEEWKEEATEKITKLEKDLKALEAKVNTPPPPPAP